MSFAETLRELREQAGMTQEMLAKRSGIKVWTLRNYEQGKREPNWKYFLSLLRALDARPEKFESCK